jgi:hypothetical protein
VCAKSQSSDLRFHEALKQFHDGEYRTRILAERLRHYRDVLRFGILDNYVSGKMSLLLDVDSSLKFDVVGRMLEIDRISVSSKNLTVLFCLNSIGVAEGKYRYKESMFVSNVECVNGPNGGIPSLARLYLCNNQIEQSGSADIYLSPSKRRFQFFDGLTYRELGKLSNGSGNQSLNSFEPGIVEGGFQVVNSISRDESDIVKCRSIGKVILDELTAGCRIYLDRHNLRIMHSLNTQLRIRDVLVGPVDLLSAHPARGHDIRRIIRNAMTPQIEKPQDEKEAIAKLTFAVGQLTEALVAIHQEVKELNVNFRRDQQQQRH